LRSEIQQEQLAQIAEDLDTALRALKWTKSMAKTAKLNETHNALYTAICNAFNSTQQAINHINDEPNTERPANQSAS
jgi:cell division protein ZapA (FtsZ GTPase activity inhibitor)